MRKIFFLIAFFGFGSSLIGQNISQIFTEGKQLFDQKQFALAQSKLAPITSSMDESNEMVQWASYYYAIAAFYSDDRPAAKNMFLQILNKYPYWEVKKEINFWIAYINASSGDVKGTFEYLNKINDDSFDKDSHNLKVSVCAASHDLNELKKTLNSFPEESVITSRIVELILASPSDKQDIDLLTELESNYELIISNAVGDIQGSPKKTIYNVGLFLPFYYRSDSTSLVRIERSWTANMYYGAQIAVQKLKDEGIDLNLITYDTRGTVSLVELSESGELDDLDLMIGPVTQSSISVLSEFSRENKINMVNPLSGNNEIIKNNPYAFLYYPSNESIARRAAEYTKKNFSENKVAAIFYSGIGDKDRADLYREIIEQDSFQVVIFEGVRSNESAFIRQMLLEEEEVDKDSLIIEGMLAEMDSLRRAEVEDWEIYDELDFVYDTLKILPDSIGHIFIASDYSSLVTSTLSGMDSRPDTIQFISTSRFLAEEQSMSYDQLDRLDAVLLGSNLINFNTPEVAEFRERFIETYMVNPTKNNLLGDAYIGYDIVVNYGRLLHNYGKYFQLGLKRRGDIEGELIEALNYRFTQDNNFIPYLKVRGTEIEVRENNNEDR